jgi:hypothetical protein
MNAAALQMLVDKGFTPQEIVEFARLIEVAPLRSKAAERQARYRKTKAERNACDVTNDVTDDVTRDVTNPPIENIIPPSVSDETGGEPPDPVKELFDLGVAMLESQGHSEREARSLLGKWRKGRSPGDVVAALVDAKTRSVSNLVEWMPRRLSGARGSDPPSFLDHYVEQQRLAGAT